MKQAVGVIYFFAAVFAVLGYSMVAMELRWRYVLAVFFVIYGFIFITAYKYGRQYALLHPAAGPKLDEPVLPEAINGDDDAEHVPEEPPQAARSAGANTRTPKHV